jgi:hypothetical protein
MTTTFEIIKGQIELKCWNCSKSFHILKTTTKTTTTNKEL